MELKGKHIVIIGLGRSGAAAARLAASHGAVVTVTDEKDNVALASAVTEIEGLNIAMALGGLNLSAITTADLVVISPGLPIGHPVLSEARANGRVIISELEFASRFITAPIVAVTGTNGKSTMVSLIGDVYRRAGRQVFVGGNIGNSLSNAASGQQDIVVAEVSSFQLEAVETFRPHIAVWMNLSPDHLDRHGDMVTYQQCKARLFSQQNSADYAVLNADDPLVSTMAPVINSRAVMFSSTGDPLADARIENETLIYGGVLGQEERIDASGRQIIGGHNLENLLITGVVSKLAGLPLAALEETIQLFTGLEHRLEKVRTLEEITYYNDSKATNVGSVIKSLESISSPVVLIAGGRDKGQDFTPLAQTANGKVKHLILIGEGADKIGRSLESIAKKEKARDLAEAVHKAREAACPGDAVLLSPGCASFDMFKDFEHRGRQFKKLVEALS